MLVMERLELTDEQAPAVAEILQNTYAERFILLDKHGVNLDSSNSQRPSRSTMLNLRRDMERLDADTRKQLGKHLSKQQMKTYKKIEKERQNRMRQRFMGGR